MADILVPDILGPRVQLCWQQSPAMARCDRARDHTGPHTWEMANNLAALPLCGEHQQYGKSHDGECFGCDLAALREQMTMACGLLDEVIEHGVDDYWKTTDHGDGWIGSAKSVTEAWARREP